MAKKKNVEESEEKKYVNAKDSIKTKLIAIMLGVAIVPIIISCLVSYIISTNKSKNDALLLLDANANYVQSQFSEIVQKNIIALQTFASAPSTITYLNTINDPEPAIPTEVILNQMDLINSNIMMEM